MHGRGVNVAIHTVVNFYLDGDRGCDRIKYKGRTAENVFELVEFLKRQKNGLKIIEIRIF